jgi:hypothetical protein
MFQGGKLRRFIFVASLFIFNSFASSVVNEISPSDFKVFGAYIEENVEGNYLVSVPESKDDCLISSIESSLEMNGKLIIHSQLYDVSENPMVYSSYVIFEPSKDFSLFLGARYTCASGTTFYSFGSLQGLMKTI